MQFTGFKEGFDDFLFSLNFNNTQASLAENKVKYRELITEPLHQLYEDLTLTALEVDANIETKKARCVSPMYNDMRFSRETPLRTYVYIRFRYPNQEENQLGLYFDMGYEYYSYGLYIYRHNTAGMTALREGMLANQKAFVREINSLSGTGLSIGGEAYARDHFPHIPQPLNRVLNIRRYFYINHQEAVGDKVFTPQLATEISEGFLHLKGFYHLIADALYK